MTATTWVIVLAGGDGTRLGALTRGADGVSVPKQFCTLGGDRTLLESALIRARRHAPLERTVVIVSPAHRRWWEPGLAGAAGAHVVVQPRNRGTAAGVLLAALHVLARDPDATLLVLPSDHAVADEGSLAASAAAALVAAEQRRRAIVLLGIQAAIPSGPRSDFGWIVPAVGSRAGVARVAHFVEKPSRDAALRLLAQGACWSSFILAARARALRDACDASVPSIVRSLEGALQSGGEALEACYETLECADFSRDVLEPSARHGDVLVVKAPPCGWSDLGTPERLAEWTQARIRGAVATA